MPAIPPKGSPNRRIVVSQLIGFIGLPVVFIAALLVIIFW